MKTKKIDLKKLAAKLKRRNREFAKLTKAQKRVRIAKDVLAQLATGKLKAKNLVYLHSTRVLDEDPTADLGAVLEQAPSCNVCALGAVFSCAVMRADNLTVQEAGPVSYYDPDGMSSGQQLRRQSVYAYVERFFSPTQRALIEMWFEADSALVEVDGGPIDQLSAEFWAPFRWSALSARKRMVAIMRNIIANGGTFEPKQLEKEYAD